jgi:hypothetical protein
MSGAPPGQLRPDEMAAYSYEGPFGGIQSEVAVDQIGRTGFAEVQNLIFRKAGAQMIPAFTSVISPQSGSNIIGIADFYNLNGVRRAVVWTPTEMFYWNGSSSTWTQVTGPGLTGTSTQYMQWDVVGYKLYFTQGADKVWQWDGITAGYSTASASSFPAKYVCEFDTHLLIANTVEAGPTPGPNVLRWSGVADGTDWTSYSSGSENVFNGLGPINGLCRLYQAAYIFQQWGITQVLTTGIGTAPFQLIPMGSRAKGSILPYGLASFGEQLAAYVGKDNIYTFDGTQCYPIGSRPIDGQRYLGARKRIFQDLYTTAFGNIFGFILTSSNGNDYESYWLLMPSLNKAWIYHFDEGTWTQTFFNIGQLNGPVGVFPLGSPPPWNQVLGTWQEQSLAWNAFTNSNQLDTMAIADANANSVSYLNFEVPASLPTVDSINSGNSWFQSNQPWNTQNIPWDNYTSDGWYVRSGALTFDDRRHWHTVKKIRFCFIDEGAITVTARASNEAGQSETHTITYGTGSGSPVVYVQEFNVTGKYITWELSGPQGINFALTEVAPIYDVGGEVQGGGL